MSEFGSQANALYGATASPASAQPAVNSGAGNAAEALYGSVRSESSPAEPVASQSSRVARVNPPEISSQQTAQGTPPAAKNFANSNTQANTPQTQTAQGNTVETTPSEEGTGSVAKQLAELSSEQVTSNIEAKQPEALREIRDTAERKLFSAQVEHASTVSEAEFQREVPGLSPEAAKVIAREVREIWGDLGFSKTEAKDLIAAGDRFDTTQSTKDSVTATEKALRAEFGKEKVAEAFSLARQLAVRDPRVAEILSRTKQGNNPAVIVAFAKAAMRERNAGRL